MTFPLSEAHHGVEAVELPITDRLVLPTRHWAQLLWANLLGLGPFLWRTLVGRNIVQVAGRLGWAVVRAGSVKPPAVMAKLGYRGTGCRVHPTAVVEGCWLGDGVDIGAGAVVRGAVLADGASVEDLALVEFSVLAPGARVQRQAMVKFSVLGASSAVGGLMQLGVLDHGAALKRTGVLMDMALGQQVEVVCMGERRSAPLGLLGVCVGAGSTVGAGVQIAPGRCIPPDVQIAAGGHSTVSVIPAGISGLQVVRDGTLVSQ
jgi:NDP-sugar pyrophosphorylase family protein